MISYTFFSTGLEETEVVNGHQQQQQPAPLSIHPTPPIPCSPAQVIGEDKKPLKKSNSSGDILSPIVSPGSLKCLFVDYLVLYSKGRKLSGPWRARVHYVPIICGNKTY